MAIAVGSKGIEERSHQTTGDANGQQSFERIAVTEGVQKIDRPANAGTTQPRTIGQ